MSKENTSRKAAGILMLLLLACGYLFADRLGTDCFLFSFSYRVQTVYPYLVRFTILCLYAAFVYYLIKNRFHINSGAVLPYLIISAGYLIATQISNGSLTRWLDCVFWSLGAFWLVTLMMSTEKDSAVFVKTIDLVYILLAACNLLFLLFPQLYQVVSDWDQETFLGYHTVVGYPLTVGVLFALLDAHWNHSRVRPLLYLLLFFANQLLIRGGVALVGTFVIFLYLLPPVRKLVEKCDLWVFAGIILVLFLVLMFCLPTVTGLAPVRYVLVNILHKDVTLTGRQNIWQLALAEIAKMPFLGHGFGESTAVVYDPDLNKAWVHAHNAFLQTLYEGGILTLLLGFGMFGYTAHKLRKCADRRLAGIFKIVLFTILIMYQGDFLAYYVWFPAAYVCHMAITAAEPATASFPEEFDSSIHHLLHKSK